jgi:hypothetical protein
MWADQQCAHYYALLPSIKRLWDPGPDFMGFISSKMVKNARLEY